MECTRCGTVGCPTQMLDEYRITGSWYSTKIEADKACSLRLIARVIFEKWGTR